MTADVVSFRPPVDVPNEGRLEFMYSVLEGLPKARQKRLILEAAHTNVGFLEREQADRLMSSLGLEAA